MPSFKLIGMFAAILLLGLSLLYAQRAGLAQGRAEGDAKYNRLVAQHANTVAAAVESARADERAQQARQRAKELELAKADEARTATALSTARNTIRALREASHATDDFAACYPVPLPDGMRREPDPARSGGP
jgi:hypothetical protein